ncbi:MAG: UDP-N-acetylmuramate dehydrogenase [Chitinophagales bacterium]|nr:UDP-N-acetylmuramate dehydrogenase [Chitinophagales bacterium]
MIYSSMKIETLVNLRPYNTFGIDTIAKAFAILKEKEDLFQLKSLKEQYGEILILGGGSNVLFTDNYNGIVIHNQLSGIEILSEDDQYIHLKVASGIHWHSFVLHTIENNWGGIENLSLIPGTVGAAPMQNIGAYGVEVKSVITNVTAYDIDKEIFVTFDNHSCQFGYRESIFKHIENKGKYFITDVTFRLQKNPANFNTSYGDIQKVINDNNYAITLKNISDTVIQIRKQKLPDPKELGNAGSFFKNPEISNKEAETLIQKYPQMPHYSLANEKTKVPAAWLIEQCGWKGLIVGNTGNHFQQALVIVNYGNATGQEIKQHAQNVQKSVFEKFNIVLQTEVNFIPY